MVRVICHLQPPIQSLGCPDYQDKLRVDDIAAWKTRHICTCAILRVQGGRPPLSWAEEAAEIKF